LVYKFYTAESPPEFCFISSGPVRKITWFEDDTGFATSSWDCTIMMFNLFSEKVSSGNVIEEIYNQTKSNDPLF
jgi:WD40 repeat protein